MHRIKVFVHASDRISEAGLTHLLREAPELQVVGDNGIDTADVAVVAAPGIDDWSEHVLAGIQRNGRPPVVLVLDEVTSADVVAVASLGAKGVVRRRSATAGALRVAVDRLVRGLVVVPDDLVGDLLERAVHRPRMEARPELNERELDVVRLLAEGSSTAEIGDELGYSERTVKGVIHDVTTRLQLKNRSHAVAYALRNGMI